MASSSRNRNSRSTSPRRHSRVGDAVQVAPYLTHVVKHHGQVTLIPPENAARIRKVKKKHPAMRGETSTSSLDLPARPGSRSRPHLPRPHSSSSVPLSRPSANRSGNSRETSHGSHWGQEDHSGIPDVPPPSFEEATLATPSPRNATPVSQVCGPPRSASAVELPRRQEQGSTSNVSSTSASPLLFSSDTESLHSESSHSSLEETVETDPRSLWEQDRGAGYSLEERVQRELERRRLADSLPHAPAIRLSEQEDTSDDQTHKIDDIFLMIQEKYRAHHLHEEARQLIPTTPPLRMNGESGLSTRPVASSSSQAETILIAEGGVSSSEQPVRHAASRKGKERASCLDDLPQECSSDSTPEISSESALSRIREVLNTPLRGESGPSGENADSFSTPAMLVPLALDHSASTQSIELSSSHTEPISHSASTYTTDDIYVHSSTNAVLLSSSEGSRHISPTSTTSTFVTPSLISIASPLPSTSSQHSPAPPDTSSSTSAPEPSFSVRRPLPPTPSEGISVRDRISAFESLQTRPIPPPPPIRPVIRRPPPPIPGPSSFDRARKMFDARMTDGSPASVATNTRTEQEGGKGGPPMPPRRRPPPPVPIRRRQESSVARLEESESTQATGSLSTHNDESDACNFTTNSNGAASRTPVESVPRGEMGSVIGQVATPALVHRPVDSLPSDFFETPADVLPPSSAPMIVHRLEHSDSTEANSLGNTVPADLRDETTDPCRTNTGREEHFLSLVEPDHHPAHVTEDATSVEVAHSRRNLHSEPSALPLESIAGPSNEPSEGRREARDLGREATGRRSPRADAGEGSAATATTQPLQPLQPMFTGLTDLDLLLARLEDPDFTFSGRSYDDLLLLEEIMGPAFGTNRSNRARTQFEDIPLGRIEVLRRRVTKDGRIKLKLALLGVVVDKCGICLVQFKDGVFACLLPCRHAFHEKCLRLWMRRGNTCPLCRGPLSV